MQKYFFCFLFRVADKIASSDGFEVPNFYDPFVLNFPFFWTFVMDMSLQPKRKVGKIDRERIFRH